MSMGELEEIREVEEEGLLGGSKSTSRTGRWKYFTILLVASLLTNIGLASYIFMSSLKSKELWYDSYETGFSSDLAAIKSDIKLSRITFTGGIGLNENGEFFTEHASDQNYVVSPSPEVDDAWDHLLYGLNIDIHSGDATHLENKTYQWPESDSYFTGLDVFHSLHCLNRLRQAMHPEYYDVFSGPNNPRRDAHIGHCIDQLRQAIQCHADLTPMEWTQVGNKLILRTDTLHTCRDFDSILHWANQRRTNYDNKRVLTDGSLFIVD